MYKIFRRAIHDKHSQMADGTRRSALSKYRAYAMRNCPFRTAKSEAQNVCKMIISIRRVGNLNNERIEVPNWVACALQLLVRKSESCTIMGGTFHTCDLPQLLEAGKNEKKEKNIKPI